jgi:hypothetical protein
MVELYESGKEFVEWSFDKTPHRNIERRDCMMESGQILWVEKNRTVPWFALGLVTWICNLCYYSELILLAYVQNTPDARVSLHGRP